MSHEYCSPQAEASARYHAAVEIRNRISQEIFQLQAALDDAEREMFAARDAAANAPDQWPDGADCNAQPEFSEAY